MLIPDRQEEIPTEPVANAHREMRGSTPLQLGLVPDPAQSQWLSLLPDLKGRNVLKVGTAKLGTIASLMERGSHTITCVGPADVRVREASVSLYGSLDAVPSDSHDVAVVDEAGFFDRVRSRKDFQSALDQIGRALRQEGFLLLCMPEGIRKLRHRSWLEGSLRRAGFTSIRHFLAYPSSDLPLTIIPYSDSPSWAIAFLSTSPSSQYSSRRASMKERVKRNLYAALGVYNYRYALLVVASNSHEEDADRNRSLAQKVAGFVSREINAQNRVAAVLCMRRLEGKQLVSVFDVESSRLLAVGKFSLHNEDPSKVVRCECENLLLLARVASKLTALGIAVPAVLHSEVSTAATLYIASALSGTRVDKVVEACHRRSDRDALARLVHSVLDMQMVLQDTLTREISGDAPEIEERLFENYLGLPIPDLASRGLPFKRFRAPQHGDFTTVNIFQGDGANKWGIIDWGGMGVGYPPLFDLFSLVKSVGFVEKKTPVPAPVELRLASFVNTFFSSTWISRLVRNRVSTYCDRYHMPYSDVYPLFLRYLLYQCGRYRLVNTGEPDFLGFYEKALIYGVRNEARFLPL